MLVYPAIVAKLVTDRVRSRSGVIQTDTLVAGTREGNRGEDSAIWKSRARRS